MTGGGLASASGAANGGELAPPRRRWYPWIVKACSGHWPSAGALCAVWLLSCTVSPDPLLWQRDAAADRDGPRLVDAGDTIKPPMDGPKDGPPLPEQGVDLTQDAPVPDAAQPPKPVCQAAALVGTTPPTGPRENALRADGLVLTTLASSIRYSTARSATDQPFGAWATTTAHPSGGDPTFFFFKGTEYGVVNRTPSGASVRALYLCSLPNSCLKTVVKYASTGKEVTDDMDGASVAVVAGKLLLVHNTGPSGSGSGDIYLAQPVSSSDISKGWATTPVTSLAVAGYKEDDPALSPDGLLIVYSGLTTSGDSDIWFASRATLSDAFGAPQQLAVVNSAKRDSDVDLAEVTIKGQQVLELYFSSDRDGASKVYRSACSY
jgi:hypothetical protein